MPNFPDDSLEFSRCWSATAGKLSGMVQARSAAEERSAQAFIRKRDEVANALRDLATHLQHCCDELSKEVDAFIAEDKRRNYEMSKMLRH